LPVILPHGAAIQYAPAEVGQLADVAGDGRNQLVENDRVLMSGQVGNRLIREMLTPWMSGARVVIAEPGRHADVPYLASLIEREGITVINTVPSLLHAMLTTCDPADLRSLRLVDTQGEVLSDDTQKEFFRLHRGRLRIRYGATELGPGLSLDCSAELLCGRPLLGRPAAGVEVHLLASNRAVTVGQEGEIHLGSPGLSSGYYQKPTETAERFVPHPFRPGAFLFRTGDIGRLRQDGIIELVGRCDDRINVRGNKLFIHDLETRIKSIKGISDAAIVVIDTQASGPRLACCAVPSQGGGEHRKELTDAINRCLPDQIMLTFISFIDAMPTTSSGKLDRERLRNSVAQRLAKDTAPTSGNSVTRQVLATVARITGKTIDAAASPLALGINSIDAVLVCAELGEVFGRRPELADFLSASSLSEVAEKLSATAGPHSGESGERVSS